MFFGFGKEDPKGLIWVRFLKGGEHLGAATRAGRRFWSVAVVDSPEADQGANPDRAELAACHALAVA
jgi:hypothetical protein